MQKIPESVVEQALRFGLSVVGGEVEFVEVKIIGDSTFSVSHWLTTRRGRLEVELQNAEQRGAQFLPIGDPRYVAVDEEQALSLISRWAEVDAAQRRYGLQGKQQELVAALANAYGARVPVQQGDVGVSRYRQGVVSIALDMDGPDGPGVEASFNAYIAPERWNGFSVPVFDLTEGLRMSQALSSLVYDGERDVFVDSSYVDEPYEIAAEVISVAGKEVKVYGIGSGWVWEEVEGAERPVSTLPQGTLLAATRDFLEATQYVVASVESNSFEQLRYRLAPVSDQPVEELWISQNQIGSIFIPKCVLKTGEVLGQFGAKDQDNNPHVDGGLLVWDAASKRVERLDRSLVDYGVQRLTKRELSRLHFELDDAFVMALMGVSGGELDSQAGLTAFADWFRDGEMPLSSDQAQEINDWLPDTLTLVQSACASATSSETVRNLILDEVHQFQARLKQMRVDESQAVAVGDRSSVSPM